VVKAKAANQSLNIVSVDAGNGMTDAVMQKPKGYGYTRFPSVRAAATGDSLGLGPQFEKSFDYVDWGRHRYLFGDDAIEGSRRGIERHQGAGRYGDEFHKFLVACAISKLGITGGEIDLTLFAPPGMYAQAKTTMQKRFAEADGNVAIKFASDAAPRSWKYSNIRVWPEGIGAAACFMLDEDGCMSAHAQMLAGEVLILDLGMHTLDALQMSDGNFNPEALAHATIENGGIKTHILEPVLRTVKKMGHDYDLLTLDDIDAVLRKGMQADNWTLTTAGQSVDLREEFQKRFDRYSQWIANTVIDGPFNGLRGMRAAIPVGGGARLVQDNLAALYEGKIMRFGVDGTTQNIDPIDANTLGGLRLAKYSMKDKK
jgi:hypothetical protein